MKSLMLKAAKEAGKIILRYYGNYGKLKFKSPNVALTSQKRLPDVRGDDQGGPPLDQLPEGAQ
mgnify:CR=1 FL=1